MRRQDEACLLQKLAVYRSESRRDLQRQVAIKAGNFGAMAEGRLHKADLKRINKVLPLTLPALVLLNSEHNIEIASRAAVNAGFTLAANPQAGAAVYTGRHADYKLTGVGGDAFALALGAGLGDDAARTLTGGARHGYLEKSLRAAHLTCSAALAAGFRLAAWGRAAAIAFGAGNVLGQGDADLVALGGLGKGDGQVVAQISPGHRPWAARCGRKAKKIAEDIAEMRKNIIVAAKTACAALNVQRAQTGRSARVSQDHAARHTLRRLP